MLPFWESRAPRILRTSQPRSSHEGVHCLPHSQDEEMRKDVTQLKNLSPIPINIMSSNNATTPPPPHEGIKLSYPAPHVLLVTIDREKQMNSIPMKVHWQMDAVFKWFDDEPNLRVAVITGAGKKSFCAGQDLIELGKRSKESMEKEPWLGLHPSSGFAGISRRTGKKPIIAAVNGFALGGGFEIVLNW